jgi:GNAT superfamily N-acetyltransferase
MIKELDTFEEISGAFAPLIPRIFSAYKYKSGSDNAWKQVDEDGNTTALLSSVDGNFTLIAKEQTDFYELKEFLNFFGYNSLVSNVPLSESAKSYSLFKYCGNEVSDSCFDFLVLDSRSTVSQYKKLHSLLFSDSQVDFDNWYCDFSKKIVNSDAIAVALTKGENLLSVATAPMIYKKIAIISGVFTSGEFRSKGFSKATIYKLIKELKKCNVTEIYLWCEESLEEFYIKLGFQKVGCTYLETEF